MVPTLSSPVTNAEPLDEGAFDLWLRGELMRLYDSALREPVPETLMDLLRGATARETKVQPG